MRRESFLAAVFSAAVAGVICFVVAYQTGRNVGVTRIPHGDGHIEIRAWTGKNPYYKPQQEGATP